MKNKNERNYEKAVIVFQAVMKTFAVTVTATAIFTGLIFALKWGTERERTVSGTIVDKRIETLYGIFFTSPYTGYRLYVEYYYNGMEFKKPFTVSENTYLSYKIGEFFDSQDFRTAPLETEKEPPEAVPQE